MIFQWRFNVVATTAGLISMLILPHGHALQIDLRLEPSAIGDNNKSPPRIGGKRGSAPIHHVDAFHDGEEESVKTMKQHSTVNTDPKPEVRRQEMKDKSSPFLNRPAATKSQHNPAVARSKTTATGRRQQLAGASKSSQHSAVASGSQRQPTVVTGTQQKPVASRSKQQPAQPTAVNKAKQPTAASSSSSNAAASINHQQSAAASGSKQQPTAASRSKLQPAANSNKPQPAAASTSQQQQQAPITSSQQQPASAGDNKQQPAVASNRQTPEAASRDQQQEQKVDDGDIQHQGHVSDPCFLSKDKTIKCLPHFMYAGLGHAGSTSLGKWLAQHPDVGFNIKNDPRDPYNIGNETRYWTYANGTQKDGPFDREDFADFFPVLSPGSHVKLGAKDPALASGASQLAKVMLDMMPWLKIVVFLREPVEHWISRNYMGYPEVQSWVEENVANRLQPHCKFMHYGVSMSTIAEFTSVFKSENVFVALTEELDTRPEQLLYQLETFLGIRHIDWGPILSSGREHVTPDPFKMTVKQRCATDLCVRPVVHEMDEFIQTYRKESTGYLPEQRSHWQETDALHKSPFVDSNRCKLAFEQLNYTGPLVGKDSFEGDPE